MCGAPHISQAARWPSLRNEQTQCGHGEGCAGSVCCAVLSALRSVLWTAGWGAGASGHSAYGQQSSGQASERSFAAGCGGGRPVAEGASRIVCSLRSQEPKASWVPPLQPHLRHRQRCSHLCGSAGASRGSPDCCQGSFRCVVTRGINGRGGGSPGPKLRGRQFLPPASMLGA